MTESPTDNSATVIVGMSGGVDSSVVALRLLNAGYTVEGLHMTNWDDDGEGYCTAAEDLQDARRVADQLGIVLHHVNFAADYRDRVFDYFLDEYRAGRTPNPDVLCNREIKFGVFADYAARLGADLIATGHYARCARQDGQATLHKGLDAGKDQSYFLHAVTAAQLDNVRFPLGELNKTEVRRLATEAGLTTHRKKDSTGICFIGERPFREFLAQYLPAQPGDIVDEHGTPVGRHHGLMYYTYGQRQGLGIGGQRGATEAPWFVAQKHLEDNVLQVVQDKHHPWLMHGTVNCRDWHWIAGIAPMLTGRTFTAKIRYRQADQACQAHCAADGSVQLTFQDAQWAVAPGQYAVLYDGDRCLGGGAIDETTSANTHDFQLSAATRPAAHSI
ncbi:MAG: tRNA 2-thiouridine(34) synthase MnmA [Pseudomonadota bacterium]